MKCNKCEKEMIVDNTNFLTSRYYCPVCGFEIRKVNKIPGQGDGNQIFYWGKMKIVNGKAEKVWHDKAMTRTHMMEWDDTYRHFCKSV